jgi:ATP-dependent Clp protease ATP-binding subunit ClpC
MIYFNLKRSRIYQAVKWGRNPIFRFSRFFKILFFLGFLILLGLFISGTLGGIFSDEILEKIFGGVILSLTFWVFFLEVCGFFELELKRPKLKYSIAEAILRPEEFNLASFLDYEMAQICFKALKYSRKKKFKQPFSLILLYFLINPNIEEINFVFGRGRLSFSELKKQIKREFLKIEEGKEIQGFKELILEAAKIAISRGKQRIGVGDVLIGFSQFDEFFKKFLVLSDLKSKDIENLVSWYERIKEKVTKSKRFWELENLLKKGSIGKDWAAGYTITLDRYSLDLREYLRKTGFREIVGHQKEIKQVERVLEKEEINNVLLVGEPGTGRKSIVEALAQRAFFGRSSPQVNFKRILKFDLTSLCAELSSREETEAILDTCFAEAVRAGNVILVIDEFHNFVSESPLPGQVNISGILARYLPLSTFQIIAITTYQGLHKIVERNPSLLNLFEKVEVSEISEREVLEFLENHVPFFERKHKRFISYKALREIIRLSARYLTQTPFPEKAIRVLDEAMSYLTLYTKDQVLEPHHIKKVVSEKIEIPLQEIEDREKEVLLNLEKLIHQRIINQTEAVREVSSALRRARAEVQVRSGPIGAFLFLGPTGVGKTETSKALAAIYFGSEKRMIRLDMSEFQNIDDIKRLIGSEKGEGLLTTPVRENPFSLVLLDEIEKAHPNILNLFLQVLDEGWLTAGDGRKVDFKNTIIIATSNAGAEIIREDIKKDKKLDIVKEDLLDFLLKKGIFRPEFINRFDAVVVFKPLTKENLLAISHLMLKKLAENLKDKGIEFEITQDLKEKIVDLGYSPQFGAREMRRVLQDKVENVLAEAILSGKLKRGNKVKVNPEDFSLIIE